MSAREPRPLAPTGRPLTDGGDRDLHTVPQPAAGVLDRDWAARRVRGAGCPARRRPGAGGTDAVSRVGVAGDPGVSRVQWWDGGEGQVAD